MASIEPLYVRVSRVQELFGLSRDTIERAHKRGKLAIHKPVGVSLIKVADLEAWIEGADDDDRP